MASGIARIARDLGLSPAEATTAFIDTGAMLALSVMSRRIIRSGRHLAVVSAILRLASRGESTREQAS